jgi:hypothetical protein
VIPDSIVAKMGVLLSAASTAEDDDLRTLYVATARCLLVRHRENLTRAEAGLTAIEKELVRTRAIESRKRAAEIE